MPNDKNPFSSMEEKFRENQKKKAKEPKKTVQFKSL